MVGEEATLDGYRLSPGCCCSPVASGCYISGDDFDRANNDDIGPLWRERLPSSGWAISGNELTTSVPYDRVIHTVPHPDGLASMIAWADVMATADGDQLRVIICWANDDNYLFAELEMDDDCGTLRLWQRSAGHNTLLKELPISGGLYNVWHTLYACYDPDPDPYEGYGRFEGRVETASQEWFAVAEDVNASGTYAGLGTGALTGDAYFDDFELWKEQTDDDPECPTCRRGVHSCVISTDDFNRANSDDLGCLWEELTPSSDWQISSNTLLTTVPYNVVQHLVPHPDGIANCWAKVLVKCATAGDIARLIVGWEDADNYVWAELEVGASCGVLRLFERVSGVVTQIGVDVPVNGATPNAWHTLEVCYTAQTASADAVLFGKVTTDDGDVATHSGEADATGAYAGLATGPLSSVVQFDDFEYEELQSAEHPECRTCEDEQDCLILEDNFDRAAGTDLGCYWQEVSGDPEISVLAYGNPTGGSMEFASAGVALCTLPHPDPDIPSPQYVWTTIWIGNQLNGGVCGVVRVYVGWLSSSEHHYVELEIVHVPDPSGVTVFDIGQAWVRCYKVTGGVASQIGSSSYRSFLWNGSTVYYGSMKVCYLGSTIHAKVTGPGGEDVESWSTTDSTGRFVAVGAGTGDYDFVRFNRFRFERHQTSEWELCNYCAEEVSCVGCLHSRGPQMIRITITGAVNFAPGAYEICSVCDELNGSQVVSHDFSLGCMTFAEGWGDATVDAGDPKCCWTIPCWKCAEQYPEWRMIQVGVHIVQLAAGGWQVRGVVQYTCHHETNHQTDYFAVNSAGRPDCDNWYRFEVPWLTCYQPDPGGCDVCDLSGAKLLLTAI